MDKNDKDSLLRRRAKILSMLESLQVTLREREHDAGMAGIQFTKLCSADRDAKSSRFGIRRHVAAASRVGGVLPSRNMLSSRGIQLAEEVWSNSCSKTDEMTMRDFRTYRSSLGRPWELAEKAASDHGSWQEYLRRINGMDASGQRMTKEGFVRYRNEVEEKCPLEDDLIRLGCNLLPSDLLRWGKMKRCLLEHDDAFGGTDRDDESRALQYTLICCGETYSTNHVRDFSDRVTQFVAVMEQLRRKYWWKSRGMNPMIPSSDSTEQSLLSRRRREALVAWFMSGRDKPTLPKLERMLLALKTSIVVNLKRITKFLYSRRDELENIVDVLDLGLLSRLKEIVSTYEGTVKIGTCERASSETTLKMAFSTIDHVNQFLRSVGMPRGAGSLVLCDFSFGDDSNKEDREQVTLLTNHLFKEHLEEWVQELPSFNSWKIFSTSTVAEDSNGRKRRVLRVGLSWDRSSDIDLTLDQMGLGISIGEILSDFRASLVVSPRLGELICNKDVTVENDVSIHGSFNLAIAREFLVETVSECLSQAEEKERKRASVLSEKEENCKRRMEMTQTQIGDCPDVVELLLAGNTEHDMENSYERVYERIEQSRMMKQMRNLIKLARHLKSSYFEISLVSLGELLFGNKVALGFLPVWLKEINVAVPGAIAHLCTQFAATIQGDMVSMLKETLRSKSKLQGKQRDDSVPLGEMQPQQSAKDRRSNTDQHNSKAGNIRSIELISLARKTLLGTNVSLRILNGANMIRVDLENLDLVLALPACIP